MNKKLRHHFSEFVRLSPSPNAHSGQEASLVKFIDSQPNYDKAIVPREKPRSLLAPGLETFKEANPALTDDDRAEARQAERTRQETPQETPNAKVDQPGQGGEGNKKKKKKDKKEKKEKKERKEKKK